MALENYSCRLSAILPRDQANEDVHANKDFYHRQM